MFTLIISVLWVIGDVMKLSFWAFTMRASKKDVLKAEDKVKCAQQHLAGFRAYHMIFLGGSVVALATLALAYWLCIIKVWVVIVDIAVIIIMCIMNILFLGYLKKQASKPVSYKSGKVVSN